MQPKGFSRSRDCDENSNKIETIRICTLRSLNKTSPQHPIAQRPLPLHTPTFPIQQPARPENATWIWLSDLQSGFPPPASVTLHADLHETLTTRSRGPSHPGLAHCFRRHKGHPRPSRIWASAATPPEPGCGHSRADGLRSGREPRGGRTAARAPWPR